MSSSARRGTICQVIRSETAPLEAYDTPKKSFRPSHYEISKLFLEFAYIGPAGVATNVRTGRAEFYEMSSIPGVTTSDLSRDMGKH